jgi:hypothetical protein
MFYKTAHIPLRNIVLTLLSVTYTFLPFLAYTFLHFRLWKLNVLPCTLTLGLRTFGLRIQEQHE